MPTNSPPQPSHCPSQSTTFFPVFIVSHSLSEKNRTRCKLIPDNPQTKLLLIAVKRSQLGVKPILRKRAVYLGKDGKRVAHPHPLLYQNCLCQRPRVPTYQVVSVGKGAKRYCAPLQAAPGFLACILKHSKKQLRLFCFLLSVYSHVTQSFPLSTGLLSACFPRAIICEVNVGANRTSARKTSSLISY